MEFKTSYNEKIYNLLMNMPKNLTDMEKARYLYLGLGRISSFSMDYWYGNRQKQKNIYRKLSSNSEIVICKTIAESFRDLLQGIGIKASTVKYDDDKDTPHYETEFYIDGKTYTCNLQGDLRKIHMRSKTVFFCYDNIRQTDVVSDEEIRKMDEKLGYILKTNTYTNEYINLLKPQINRAESLEKKVRLIHSFADRLTKARDTKDLEKIQFYIEVVKELLCRDELKRIRFDTQKDENGKYKTYMIVENFAGKNVKNRKKKICILINETQSPEITGEER